MEETEHGPQIMAQENRQGADCPSQKERDKEESQEDSTEKGSKEEDGDSREGKGSRGSSKCVSYQDREGKPQKKKQKGKRKKEVSGAQMVEYMRRIECL